MLATDTHKNYRQKNDKISNENKIKLSIQNKSKKPNPFSHLQKMKPTNSLAGTNCTEGYKTCKNTYNEQSSRH